MLIFVCIPLPLLQGDLFASWNDIPVLPCAGDFSSREKRDLLLPEEHCTHGQSQQTNSVMGDYIVLRKIMHLEHLIPDSVG